MLNVYDSARSSMLPDNTATNIVAGFSRNVNHAVDLNSFFGDAPAINRATGVRGPFVTDPSCLYDAATQRFFVTVLTLDALPSGTFTTVNHIDIAVSKTADPTSEWNIYRHRTRAFTPRASHGRAPPMEQLGSPAPPPPASAHERCTPARGGRRGPDRDLPERRVTDVSSVGKGDTVMETIASLRRK